MYEVIVHPLAKKSLLRMQDKDRKRISDVLQSLSKIPRPHSAIALTAKNLGDYRIRSGDWRVRYDVDDQKRKVFILDIGRRDKAYRQRRKSADGRKRNPSKISSILP